MTKKEFPEFNSEEIDLSKLQNFQIENTAKPHIASPIDDKRYDENQSIDSSPVSDGLPIDGQTVDEKRISSLDTPLFNDALVDEANINSGKPVENAFLEEDLEIPKFLLKNNTEDAASFEEDKFVNRSLKMVQDACKTLTEEQQTPQVAPAVDAGEGSGDNSVGAPAPSPKGSSWKFPASIAAAIVAAGALFTYQGNGPGSFFGESAQDNSTAQTLVASGYGGRDDAMTSLKDTDTTPVTEWGAIAAENNGQQQVAPGENNSRAVTLSNDQYNSLKARLNSAPVVVANRPETQGSAQPVVNPGQKMQQIAALVAEQTPAGAKSTRSLNQVNADARALEADIDNTVASIKALQPTTPVIVAPVKPVVKPQPVIKLAQNTTAADNRLKLLTNNVVQQLTRLKNFEENPETADIPETQDLRNSINQLVAQATSENLDSTAIEGLLQEALADSNAIPQALARADGKLDTRLLLMSVLSQVDSAQVKSSDAAYLSALDDEGSSTVVRTSLATIEAASSAENARIKTTTDGRKTIKVEIGDTLSKIAFAVYGDALTYTRIFKANRKQLKNPNLLTVGMVLVLP